MNSMFEDAHDNRTDHVKGYECSFIRGSSMNYPQEDWLAPDGASCGQDKVQGWVMMRDECYEP